MSNKFDVVFNENVLQKLLPRNRNIKELYEAMEEILPKYGITTENRLAMFIGQCGHESRDFTVFKENLNYSAKGLRRTFRKYFTPDLANRYARNPRMIANRVYANRMGNGSEASGDGWKFRGRGAIQLTGHNNHAAFAKSVDMTIDESLAYIDTTKGSIEAACYFWKSVNLNKYSDRLDILGATKRINGGRNGLADRRLKVRRVLAILNTKFDVDENLNPVLKKGARGEEVIVLQKLLTKHGYRVSIDGAFGPGTRAAVHQYQEDNQMISDGIVGRKTWKSLRKK